MAPFRWPEARHELALAKEVAQHNPGFKMDRILTKYKEEDMKALKR